MESYLLEGVTRNGCITGQPDLAGTGLTLWLSLVWLSLVLQRPMSRLFYQLRVGWGQVKSSLVPLDEDT